MPENRIVLVKDGKSPYVIVSPADATPAEKYAAEELQLHICQSSGVTLPIVPHVPGIGSEYSIFVGPPPRPRPKEEVPSVEGLGEEGLHIKTLGCRIVITGGRPRGALYGVYAFLEKYLGCRWFTPELTHVPKRSTIEIPKIDYRYVPRFIYRHHHVCAARDAVWATRNRLNSYLTATSEALGGVSGHGTANHSFAYLVSPAEYFETHPEYFSEVDGVRLSERTQLCLSNPDVLEICTRKIRDQLSKSKAIGVSVAQNDCLNPCQCPKCREIDEYHGGHSGSIIRFVNKIAEAVCDEFPDRLIQTYAYQYGQIAPKNIKCHPNVAVWLCSIESCFAHAQGECHAVRRELPSPDGRTTFFAQDIIDWSKICDNLFVWDYVTNFRNFVHPHPNLQSLKKNIDFFSKYGVKGVFEQGCSTSINTEMQEVRAYMIARMLWDPEQDDKNIQNEFLTAYYGQSAPFIADYIKVLQDEMTRGGHHLFMSTMPDNLDNHEDSVRSSLARAAFKFDEKMPTHALAKYMTPEVIAESNRLFDLAEATADDQEKLDHVRIARLPLRFTEFSIMPMSDPARMPLIESFFRDLNIYGITELKEAKHIEESYIACRDCAFVY